MEVLVTGDQVHLSVSLLEQNKKGLIGHTDKSLNKDIIWKQLSYLNFVYRSRPMVSAILSINVYLHRCLGAFRCV